MGATERPSGDRPVTLARQWIRGHGSTPGQCRARFAKREAHDAPLGQRSVPGRCRRHRGTSMANRRLQKGGFEVLDSRHWKSAEVVASGSDLWPAQPDSKGRRANGLPFQLDGEAIPTSRSSSRRTWISTTEGVVMRQEGGTLRIGETHATLRHSVAPTFDMGALLGRRVRATLVHVASIDSGLAQTLTISGASGELLILAHVGDVHGLTHTLSKLVVYVALSQRPRGPMVFGTSRLQTIVREGDHVRVRDDGDTFVLHFAARLGNEATYAIGREDLWRGPPSTMR
jgi:hypothetical protein